MLLLVLCALLQGTNGFWNPLENPYLFEGDILPKHRNPEDRSEVLTDVILQQNGDNPFKTAPRTDRALTYDLLNLLNNLKFPDKKNAEDRSEVRTNEMIKRNGDETFKSAPRQGRALTYDLLNLLNNLKFPNKKNAQDRSEVRTDEMLLQNEEKSYKAAPSTGRLLFWSPLENPYLFQGDILLHDEAEARSAVPKDKMLWPGGVIPYKIDPALDGNKTLIMEAMDHIMSETCIKFVPWNGKKKHYVYIFSEDGCYSNWGRIGGKQYLSLGKGCLNLGIILHELMHTIGFDHEQNRPDRDEYLKIYWNNIWPDELDQFDLLQPHQTRIFNGFDFDSIMLYGPRAFSKGYFKTMKSRVKGVYFSGPHTKNALSASDIYRVNTLYKCNKKA